MASCTRAAEQPLPRNDGWVTDLGGFLSQSEEAALESLMESYRRGGSHEVALLTVPDLGGRSLERLSLETARAWGLGREGKNDGLLILLTRRERKLRIEVGRGLEGMVTDSISGRIIRDVMTPGLSEGRMFEALRAGVVAVHEVAGGNTAALPPRRAHGRSPGRVSVFGLLVPLLFIGIAALGAGRGHRGRGGGNMLFWILLSALGGRRGGGSSGWGGGGGGGGGFGGFGGGGGFSGGGASGGW